MDSRITPLPTIVSPVSASHNWSGAPERHMDSTSRPKDLKEIPGLTHFNRARRELELAASIDEVKEIRDKAEAMRIYARQAEYSLEMQNLCAEIQLRAERRLGEMLREVNPTERRQTNLLRGRTMQPRDDAPSLADIGISKSQSSRWQMIASVSVVYSSYLYTG